MARFSDQTIERVKEAVDMASLVGAKTDLRRQGQRMQGLCPFHDERTPSFSVDPVQKLYHCFGCGASGDVITFVEETEGLDFSAAVEVLADRFGVEVEREAEDPRAEEQRKNRERLRAVLDRAARFYFRVLMEREDGAAALRYLEGRGLRREVLSAFRVGFAPGGGGELVRAARSEGFTPDELMKAGLAGRRGGDFFRNRITFPIADARGRVVGFGARAMSPDDKAKYINSPEGRLFAKKSIVFGIDRARAAIAKQRRAVVVEGYTDVLAAHQAGMEEAVAVMGTAVTPEQLKQLSSLAETVVLALDADRAGQDAMVKAQRVASEQRLRLMVARMPEGEDPCDLISARGAEEFTRLVDGAVDMAEFRVRMTLDRLDGPSAFGRDEALREVGPILGAMGESIARTELERLVASRLGADPALVRSAMRAPAPAAGTQAAAPEGRTVVAPRSLSGAERRERSLFALCLAAPAEGKRFLERLTPEHLGSEAAVRAAAWMKDHVEAPLDGLGRDDAEVFAIVSAAQEAAGREPASVQALEIAFLQLDDARMTAELDAARRNGDEARHAEVIQQRQAVRARIRDISGHPQEER